MVKRDIWLWPRNTLSADTICNSAETLASIETFFNQLYSPFRVVYFSRARVAINAISAVSNLSRAQLTFVQPFSSHCVLSAVSSLSTPSTTVPSSTHQQIIYHQWGNTAYANKQEFANPIIEDAVDSLISDGDKKALFPNNAPFCIISLPKITGLSIGAIVVCQHQTDQNKLINYRGEMSTSTDISTELLDIPALTESILHAKPNLVPRIVGSIEEHFLHAFSTVRKNITALSELYPNVRPLLDGNRLPANIIINDERVAHELYPLLPFNVVEPKRMFFDYQTLTTKSVNLIPTHCQARWD